MNAELAQNPMAHALCPTMVVWDFKFIAPQDALSSNSRTADLQLAACESRWHAEHAVVEHDKQTPIVVDKNKLFKEKECLKLGICVCSRQKHVKMHKALLRSMKAYFTKENKVASPQLRLLEDWCVVLQLSGTVGNIDKEVYLHVGAANFRTWEFFCLRLEEFEHDESTLTLRVCGLEATESLEVLSLLQFLVGWFDPAKPCSVHFLQVVSDGRPLPADLMKPEFVDVKALQEPHEFWSGDQPAQGRKRRRVAARRGPRIQRPREERAAPAANAEQDDDGPEQDEAEEGSSDSDHGDAGAEDLDEAEDVDMLPDEEAAADREAEDEEEDLHEQQQAEFLGVDDPGLEELFAFADDLEPGLGNEDLAQDDAELDMDLDALFQAMDDEMQHQPPQEAAAEAAAVPPAPAFDGDGARPGRRPPRPRAARAVPAVPGQRAARNAEIVYDMQGFGLAAELRYNERGFLRAHCKDPRHGQACRRQRQTTVGRLGAGRPVGSLICWLQAGAEAATQAEHVSMGTATHEARCAARAWFENLAGSSLISGLEREVNLESDGPGREPRILP